MSNLKVIIVALLAIAGSSGLNYWLDVPPEKVQKLSKTQIQINESEKPIIDDSIKADPLTYEIWYIVENKDTVVLSGPGKPEYQVEISTQETKRNLFLTDKDWRDIDEIFIQKWTGYSEVKNILKIVVVLQ